jgi:hypothetical protein
VRLGAALHRLAARRAASALIEDHLGGTARDDGVGDRIGVRLVAIARLVDALERDTIALLEDVSRLVCGGVEIRLLAKGDAIAVRIRLGTERVGRVTGVASHVRADVRDVVATERTLDLIGERQLAAGPADTLSRDLDLLVGVLGDRGRIGPRHPVEQRAIGSFAAAVILGLAERRTARIGLRLRRLLGFADPVMPAVKKVA